MLIFLVANCLPVQNAYPFVCTFTSSLVRMDFVLGGRSLKDDETLASLGFKGDEGNQIYFKDLGVSS